MLAEFHSDRRGISGLVAVVLLLLITTSSTAIIGTAVLPLITSSLDFSKACTNTKVNVNLQSGYSCFYRDIGKVGVMISIPPGEFELAAIQVVLKGRGKTESVEINQSLAKNNEEVTYLISTTLGKIEEITVAPIVKVGQKEKICGVTYIVSENLLPVCPGSQAVGIPVGGGGSTCSDGIQNGGETGVDCGGVCVSGTELLCSDGIDNDRDCLIDAADPNCAGPTCSDGIQNGGETGVDCGGTCVSGTELLCSDGIDNDRDCLIDAADPNCAGPTCSDGIQNGGETGVDCGGACITGTELLCSNALDDDRDCAIDAADSDCIIIILTPTNRSDGFSLTAAAGVGAIDCRGITYNGSDFWVDDTGKDFVDHVKPTGTGGVINITNGFNLSAVSGIGATTTRGIATNNSDLWIVDNGDDFIYHVKPTGTGGATNFSNGFKILTGVGAADATGITYNGSDFWVSDSLDDFVYHVKRTGAGTVTNFSNGFRISTVGAADSSDIVTNGSDFWITDSLDDFVYHVKPDGAGGVTNYSDGFDISGAGAANSEGITTNILSYNPSSWGPVTDFWICDNTDDFVYHLRY